MVHKKQETRLCLFVDGKKQMLFCVENYANLGHIWFKMLHAKRNMKMFYVTNFVQFAI